MSEQNEPQAPDTAPPVKDENETTETPFEPFRTTVDENNLVEDDEIGAPPLAMPE